MNIIQNNKLIGFAAYSGTGKTTLIKEVVSILKKLDYKISVIKHAHHDFDVDKPGKDSYEIRKSGADNMLISSTNRWVLMHDNKGSNELSLRDLIKKLEFSTESDVILVEGFKAEKFPKIELYRKKISEDRELLSISDNSIVAIATDDTSNVNSNLPVLDINKPHDIAAFLLKYLKISKKSVT